jgi:predicted exporter
MSDASSSRSAARYGFTVLCFCALALVAGKTVRIESDFTAFLPPSATAEERLLISQLRDGLVSRLMLVALHGLDEITLSHASRSLAAKLARAPEFDYAANGGLDQFAVQAEVLMRHRYALSPNVNSQHFSVPALRAALEEQLAQLGSPAGMLSRSILTRDPTGELLATLRWIDSGSMPALRHGVWFSADGKRAFLIAQTRAAGFDSVRQASAMAAVRNALAEVNPKVDVTLTGPGVFAAESRRLIRRDALTLSLCSALLILTMLVFVYRSALPVALVLAPVAFGLLIGVLAVQTLFGSIHGITLGFAATLIGETVDYPNYLLLNTAKGETARSAASRLGRTLALVVLTTVASALALALSSFAGLAQLGVLTMIGVTVAGLATHRLIPWLLGGRILDFRRLHVPTSAALGQARWPRWVGLTAILCGALWLTSTHPAWWERDLANISPIPEQMRTLDKRLRSEMGAPEMNHFLVSRGASETAALRAADAIRPLLQQWKQAGWIRSYESPAWYLPALDTQADRLRSLPDTPTLQKNLSAALQGLPFRTDAFAPFVQDVAEARVQAPLTRVAYTGTPLGAKLNALVFELDGQWLVLTPLAGVSDTGKLTDSLSARPLGGRQDRSKGETRLIDLKQISTQMVDGFSRAALQQAALGALLIVALLTWGLRSLRRTWHVAAPAAAALVLTAALLTASGQRLGVFHLVALLLVLGIGLNYALFFERPSADAAEHERTHLALAVCSISTIATFGFLSLSATPVLHAIGSTVALGALVSLVLAGLWARPSAARVADPMH